MKSMKRGDDMKSIQGARKGWLSAAGLALALLAGTAAAQNFPTKPLRIVVPFAPGGVADISARVLGQKMSENLGQQVLVENRPSAGGVIAGEAVAKSDPDGHVMLLVSNGTAVSASLFRKLPFNTLEDFAGVSTLGFFDLVLVVNGDSKMESIRDLIAYARSNPGKLNIGTINIGSTQNLAGELFKSMSGVSGQIVPFKGTPDVVTALRGNEIQVAVEILAPVMSQIKAGGLKPLAVTSLRRSVVLPNVPTVDEGGVSGYDAASWNGIAVPSKSPRATIDRLSREINVALSAPDIKKRLFDLGVDARPSTPEALQKLLASEIAKWGGVIERAKIPKQ